jgi:eukaryotic-like serine/threonine-protein kinase
MDAPQVASHFLELLEHSELLSPQQLRTAVGKYDLESAQSAREAAVTLMSSGLLTRFQVRRLLAGRARGFYYDRFKLLDVLGHGGMSCVYRAEDTQSGSQVALKVLAERYKHDAGMITRLKLEALVGRKLRHPHVLHTLGIGEAAGVLYIVMEHFEAIELQELIDNSGPLPVAHACDVIRQAAEGLHAAHRTGIVHRDVKPANLMIDRGGFVKVLDFGLSLLGPDVADEEFSLAMIFGHECLGTAYYMPPEQSRDSNAVDARADIYGLGCTLYHALAGRVPFPVVKGTEIATVPQVIAAHRERPLPPLQEFVPHLPDQLALVVDRMTAKDPKDRFATAADVAAALEPFADQRPIDVDVRKILSRRIRKARRRLSASQTGRSQSAITRMGSQQGSSVVGSGLQRSGSRIETAVSHDTRPEHGSAVRAGKSSVVMASPSSVAGDALQSELAAAAGPISRPAFLLAPDGAPPICLDRQRIVIGRDADCDIVLAVAQISGKHCELRCDEGRWSVNDLGSKNGVQVNGKSVKSAALRSGDRLSIAHYEHFRFQSGDAAAPSKTWFWIAGVGLLLAAAAAIAWAFNLL